MANASRQKKPIASTGDVARRMCRALVRVIPVDGAATSIHQGVGVPVTIGVSDPAAEAAEFMQFDLGEGPTLTCAQNAERVLEPDLNSLIPRALWPAYVPRMLHGSPHRAVFVFPLRARDPDNRITATVSLYQHQTNPLDLDAIKQVDRLSGWMSEILRDSVW